METKIKIVEDPVSSCRIGEGTGCCIYLTSGAEGFICEKDTGSKFEKELTRRLHSGSTTAKGTGDWEECEWK